MKRILTILILAVCICLPSLSTSFPGVKPSGRAGNLYVINIGIDKYIDFSLKYSKSDAVKLGTLITNQYKSAKILSTKEPQVKILIDSLATFSAIDAAFREMSRVIKPEDYFVFCYSAVSVQLKDGDINFYTHNSAIQNAYKAKEEKDNANPHFNLTQLKNWLNLITAKNQMLISEAGDGKEFANNLQKIVMGTDPLEAIMSDRNRVILSTNSLGFEGSEFGGGALASFLLGLKKNNLFDLFQPEKRTKVEFEIVDSEMRSNLHSSSKWGMQGNFYTNFFYESQVLDLLRNFKDALSPSKTRGGEAEVEPPKQEQGIQRDLVQNYALIIGINDYDSPSWNDLTNPLQDAKAVESDLKNLYGFKTEMLTNPTKTEISQALYKYSKMKFDSVKSQFLIFWAGHGGYDEFTSGYLVARDSKSKEEDGPRDTYYAHSRLRDMLTNIKCPHVMLVLDACFGGTFDQKLSKSSHRGEKEDPLYADVIDDSFLKRKLVNHTRLYITSGGKTYVPDGRPGQHSPFARQFLALLRGSGGSDGILTFSEIKTGIERLTPEPCAGEFDGNDPGSDFLFISKK